MQTTCPDTAHKRPQILVASADSRIRVFYLQTRDLVCKYRGHVATTSNASRASYSCVCT